MVGGCVCSRIPRQSCEYYCLYLIRIIEFPLKCCNEISLLESSFSLSLSLSFSRPPNHVPITSRVPTSQGKSKVLEIHRYRFVCSSSSCFLCRNIFCSHAARNLVVLRQTHRPKCLLNVFEFSTVRLSGQASRMCRGTGAKSGR